MMFTQISRVDFPILIIWMNPFQFLGSPGICFSFFRSNFCIAFVPKKGHGAYNAEITLKIQSADKIFVFLSADKHQFVGRLKLLH